MSICLRFGLLLILAMGAALQGASETWNGSAGDNNWNNAANWSGGVPAAGDDATVAANCTLSVATASLNSLTITSGAILIDHASGVLNLVTNGALTITNGTLSLQGGGLTNAVVSVTSGVFIGTSISSLLTNVTIATGTTLDLSQTSATCAVTGNLVVDGTIKLGNAAGTTSSTLNCASTQIWGGSGDILFGNSASNIIGESAANFVLTIAGGLTIHGTKGTIDLNSGTDSLVNNGTIAADVAGGTIAITAYNWTNNATGLIALTDSTITINAFNGGSNLGTISATTGSTLTIASSTAGWSNSGTISCVGTTFNLGGSFTTATGMSFSAVTSPVNTVNITGAVDNSAGMTFSGSVASWHLLVNGEIDGGSITSTGSANTLVITNGTLSAVTIPSGSTLYMTQVNGATCTIANGITIDGEVQIGNASGTITATMNCGGTQTWTGTGDILFGDSASDIIGESAANFILTIDTHLLIHGAKGTIDLNSGTDSLVNNGTIAADVSGGVFAITAYNWTNNGTISLNDATMTISAYNSGSNLGTIASTTGSTLTFASGSAGWSNGGTLSCVGTTFNLGGNYTSATGLTFSAITSPVNTVNITGTVDNSAGITFSSSLLPWNLHNGTISGGTITSSTSSNLIITTGTLTAVTIPMGSTLDLTTVNGATCTIQNGISIYGEVDIGNAGGSVAASMNCGGTQTWTGTGDILFGGSTGNTIGESAANFILTIDTGLLIHGNKGSIVLNSGTDSLVNNGTIAADVSGGAILVTAYNWTNTGAITLNNSTVTLGAGNSGSNTGTISSPSGGTLNISSAAAGWTNTGTISGANTIYNLGGYFTSATGLSVSHTASNTVNITGNVANTSSAITFTGSTSSWYLRAGTITGGTIVSGGGNNLYCTNNGGSLVGVTIPSGSVLDLATINQANCSVTGGLTINGEVVIGNTAGTTFGTLNCGASQTWGGSGDILFGGMSGNSIGESAASITLTIGSGLTVHGENGAFVLNSGAETLINTGTIASDVPGGTFSFNCSTVSNQGVMTIGVGVAQTWSFNGAFVQTAAGTLNIDIGGTGALQSDKLAVVTTANLGGTLHLDTINSYNLTQGDAITIITTSASGLSGTFASVTGSTFTPSYTGASAIVTAQDSTTPSVTVTSSPLFSPVSPIVFSITFSEPVTGLGQSGLVITGGTYNTLSGTGSSYTASVIPNALTGGVTNEPVTLQVAAGAATNSGSHANTISNTEQVIYERPPTITISPANNATVNGAPTFTITTSNPVTGLVASGMTLTNANVLSITPSSPSALTSTYTVATTMSGQGAMTFQLKTNAVIDQAGNGNTASTTETVINDSAPPTISSIAPTTGTTVTSAPTFIITFSEPITGLTSSQLTVTGGTIGTISPTVPSDTYSVPILTSSSGTVTLAIAPGAVTDGLGGSNQAGASDTLTVNLAPTFSSLSPTSGPQAGGTNVTLTGTNFNAATVKVGGVSASVVSQTGTSIVITTPPSVSEGLATVIITNSDSEQASLSNAFDYLGAPPTLTAVSPVAGPPAGGTSVTLTGTNFVSGSTVTIGGAAAPVTSFSATTITVTAPAGTSGPSAVIVTNPDLQTASLSTGYYYQGAPPTLTLIAPANGSSAGGTSVTLTGTNFESGATVTIGPATATSVVVVSPTSITAITPAGTGAQNVVVHDPDLQVATLSGTYTYVVGAPSLSSISPSVGPVAGGTTVALSGTNFAPGATVTFGGVAASSVNYISPTTIDAITPAGVQGPVTVVVTNPDTQTTNLPNGFIYQGVPPTLSGVSPDRGPLAGGTPVTLTGAHFAGGIHVTFNGVSATSITLVNATALTAVAPAGAFGPATVVVTNTDLQSSAPVTYYYQGAPPNLTGVAPGAGPLAGGTTVTLTGTNFVAGAEVSFGSATAASVVVVNSTTITAVTSAGEVAGPLAVTVTNADQQSFTLNSSFDYQGSAPTIIQITPAAGSNEGDGTYTITGTNFQSGASVSFGSTPAESVNVVNSTTIQGFTGESSEFGPVDVIVTNPDLQSATLPGGYDYQGAAPTVTSLIPTSGSTAGGTIVTLSGTNFVIGAIVTIGGVPASVGSLSATTITATTPPGVAGAAAVVVTNRDLQGASLPGGYTYVTPGVNVTASTSATNIASIVFTVTFSLPPSEFTAADVDVANGTVGAISGGPLVYTVPVTATDNGPVTLQVHADAAEQIPASNTATVVFDTVPPSAHLTIATGTPVTAASVALQIAFDEPVLGFTGSALTISNATAAGFTAVDAATFTVQLTALANPTASIQILIPAGACTDLAGNASLAATLIIPLQSTVLSTGVVTPPIGVSSGPGTLYTALCPGTWAGLAQVQAFLSGKQDNQAVGYVWDASAQGFVQVPENAPQGGWQPDQGVYLATRSAPAFNFNGYMATVDYDLVLKPGWNFVGIPPLIDNGVETISHNWSDLRLEDLSGDVLAGTERTGLIDVGAWSWNGSAYVQTSGALQSGQGYWIENSSAPGVDLVLRRLSAAEIADPSTILGGLRLAPHAIGYRAHTSPPQPPGANAAGSGSSSSSSSGCGLGSGLGIVVLIGGLMLRARTRATIRRSA